MTYKAKPQAPLSAILYTPAGSDDFIWYVVETAPAREQHAARELAATGLTVFVPFKTVWRRVGKGRLVKNARISHPAFFNYIFASFGKAAVDWNKLAGIKNIAGVITVDGEAYEIGPHAMADIAARAEAGEFNAGQTKAAPRFKKGDHVRATVGPLRGYDFEVQSIKGEKATLLVEMLGKKNALKLPVDALIAST